MRAGTATAAVVAAVLFCWLAAVTMHGGLAGFDEAVRTSVHALAAPWLTASVEALTWLGAWGVLAVFSGVTAVVLNCAGRSRDVKLLLVIMAGAVVLENALKFSIQRPRPPPFFGTDPTTYSFPSGHALFSLCFYGAFALVLNQTVSRVIVWPAAVVIVAAIGGTRIYLGVHYPTDVIAGYLVATAWLCTVQAVQAYLSSTGQVGADQRPPDLV